MKKSDLTFLPIDSVDEVVTNADVEDVPSNYAIDARGVRLGKEGMVVERMFGTKKLYDTYPTVPAAGVIAGGYRFYNKDNDTEYDIIITTDPTMNYSRIYVYDSAWIELTRTFTAVVSATPAATTDTTVDINTIKDSLGTTYALAADELNNYICLNTNRALAVYVTDTSATVAGASVVTIPNYAGEDGLAFVSGNNLVFFRTNWLYNNFYKADASAWTGTEINLDLGATPHNRWLPVEAQKKVNLALGSSANSPIMKNLQRIQLCAAKPLFYDGTSAYLLTLPAGWDAETVGGLCTYFLAKGTAGTPILTTLTNEAVTVAGDTNSSGISCSPFLKIIYDVTHTSASGANEVHLRMAVTLEYDNYQESDPIYRGYFQCPGDNTPAIIINSIALNPATMPKHLTAVNFYVASHNDDLIAGQWPDSDADYKLVFSMPINSTQYNSWGVLTDYTAAGVRWVLAPTGQYCYSLTCGTTISITSGVSYTVGRVLSPAIPVGIDYSVNDVLTLVGGSGDATVKVESLTFTNAPRDVSLITPGVSGYIIGDYATTVAPAGGIGAIISVTTLSSIYNTSTNGTLAGRLAHATDSNRSLITPRYMVKSARDQAAILVMDKDEATLRLTCYNGSGGHEDDNLPDITADSNGKRQLIALNGKGIMGGEAISRDVITVLRSTEAETFDLQNGSQQIFDIDFLAKNSLVKSPYGLTWAGRTGIWWLPENGSSMQQINLKWGNRYDGSEMTDNGTTPYLTDAYRSAIISGYDPYHKSVIFSYQINKKDNTATPSDEYMTAEYEFEKDRWSFKVLGSTDPINAPTIPKFFSQTTKVKSGTDWVNGTDWIDASKLIIGTTTALAVYPNLTGAFPYTDLETAVGDTGSGFDTNITVNIKELNNQVQSGDLQCILVDYQGASTDGAGNFQIDFYANDQVTPFDTQWMAIDRVGEFQNVGVWGDIDSLRVKLSLVGTLSNFKKWDVSRVILGFKKNMRKGNI